MPLGGLRERRSDSRLVSDSPRNRPELRDGQGRLCASLAAIRPSQAHVRMSLTDWELWAVANETIRQDGADAPIFAAMRVDRLERNGYPDGARAWREIIRRINQLLEPGILH